jgi:hypothetical protein
MTTLLAIRCTELRHKVSEAYHNKGQQGSPVLVVDTSFFSDIMPSCFYLFEF